MKILILGADGMLGTAVTKYFSRLGHEVTALTRNNFDIGKDDHEKARQFIQKVDVVINCAGVIKPRIQDHSLEEVMQINGIFPWNLAKMCQQEGVKCFHAATDCVFSGKKGNYDESDLVDANDLYGLSKAAGDTPLAMTLRTSIIGEEQSQARSLLSWAMSQKGKTVNGFTNHIWNGVTTVYFAELIAKILENNLFKAGIWHIHSPAPISKDKLLKDISAVYGLDLIVNPMEAPEAVDRSLSSIHRLSRNMATKTIRIQLEEMKEFFSNA